LDGEGQLEHGQFFAACERVRARAAAATHTPRNAKRWNWNWFENHNRLFESMALQGDGLLRRSCFVANEVRLPMATWWRLTFLCNWGCPRDIQVGAPLRLLETRFEVAGRAQRSRGLLEGCAAPAEDLSMAFDMDRLGLTNHEKTMRKLAIA